MAQELPNLKIILPHGEALRELISQSFITSNDLRTLLRKKGIFINRNNKELSVPLLMTCLLSPEEFDFLREKQITKEDTLKTHTFTLDWKSENSKPLIQYLPSKFSLNELIQTTYKKNYEIQGNPQFSPVEGNPDFIKVDYELLRNDRTKDWANNKSRHKGSITIERTKDKLKLILTNNHTATETTDIGNKAIKRISNHLKYSNFVNDKTELKEIGFSDFTNENRIQFFYSFTADNITDDFICLGITDLNISPDNKAGNLPADISKLLDKVNDLSLKAVKNQELREHIFVTEKSLHSFLHFLKMEIKYSFSLNYADGNCSIVIGFPEFQKKKNMNSGFQIHINTPTLKNDFKHVSKSRVTKDLNRIFESYKLKQYEKFKKLD